MDVGGANTNTKRVIPVSPTNRVKLSNSVEWLLLAKTMKHLTSFWALPTVMMLTRMVKTYDSVATMDGSMTSED